MLLFLIPGISLLRGQEPEEIDWTYEIDLLGEELVRKHPDPFFRADSAMFFHALDRVAEKAGDQSLFEVSLQLQQVIAMLGDAHTGIHYHFLIQREEILPLECYWFEEGIFVLETTEAYSGILGKRVVSVNDAPIGQVIDSLSTLLAGQHPSHIRARTVRMIPWINLLQHFGFAGPEGLKLGYEDASGTVDFMHFHMPFPDGTRIAVEPDRIPLGWKDRQRYFLDRYLADEKCYYIQYNHCWSREVEATHGSGAEALFMPSFREFEKRVFRTIRRNEIEKLVIDLRFNEGGVASQGSKFIERLSRTGLNGRGKIFVLIGRNTCAAAVVHAVELINQTDAVTVGEPTGGRPNHFGDIHRFVLPESGLVVSYPERYIQLMEGDPPALRPDMEVPCYFSDYMKGVDACLEAVMQYGEQ